MTDVLVSLFAILISIVLHEVAHGYTAYLLGDNTAYRYGRLSLNPIRHIDIFGTILFPLMLILSKAGFVFGWAKPVPVDFNALKKPKIGIVLVSAAGIVTNILLAILCSKMLPLINNITPLEIQKILHIFLVDMIFYNILLAIFNILPIPPLDGSKILLGWSNNQIIQRYLDADKIGTAFIVFAAFIIPAFGGYLGYNWNYFGSFIINSTRYFINMLI